MKVEIFISYSHMDKAYLADNDLLGFIKGLEHDEVNFWWDESLITGDSWDEEIRSRIKKAHIALVLVSQWLLDSVYCTDVEINEFLQECRKRGLVIFPVILSPCEWQKHEWLKSRQFLPREKETIEEHYLDTGRRKRLFLLIRQDLGKQIQRIRQLNQEASAGINKDPIPNLPQSPTGSSEKQTPDYPYSGFSASFRDVVAPKRLANNSVLNIVFGNLSDIHEATVVLPVGQSFDFNQRGSRSVLASFEKVQVKEEPFFTILDKLWPQEERPKYAGIGNTHLISLPPNSHSLSGVLFAVTTRDLSSSSSQYGLYVSTPIEGIDYILDNVFTKANQAGVKTLAVPLLGTGYANIRLTHNNPNLQLQIRQAVLCLTIQKLEDHLTKTNTELKRGIIVIYSPMPQGEEENSIWNFVIRFIVKDRIKRGEQINDLMQAISSSTK